MELGERIDLDQIARRHEAAQHGRRLCRRNRCRRRSTGLTVTYVCEIYAAESPHNKTSIAGGCNGVICAFRFSVIISIGAL